MENGKLLRRIGNEKIYEDYYMKLVLPDELDSVMELQEHVYKNLPNKNVLFCDEYDDIYNDLKGDSKILGVYNSSSKLIAYRYISVPGITGKNLGLDIGLSGDELKHVAHLETTVVHPEYRGNNLQSLTLVNLVPQILELGYNHLICTISPQNPYSLYNIMKNGLSIKALKRKYITKENENGLWRFILHMDLNEVIDLKKVSLKTLELHSYE
ncbi:MAG: hypothetical protein WBA54_01860, partial [Acidaminobacteraceae bacterium]